MHRRTPLSSLAPVLALALAALPACGDRGARAEASPARAAAPVPAAAPVQEPGDRGDFLVRYSPVSDETYARWQADFRQARVLEDLAAGLNRWISLPRDVTLTFAECDGDPNAFYDPDTRTVSVCFEFIEHLDSVFAADDATPTEHESMVLDATTFILYHEVGHALVDLLQIPVAGREEDAADGLATVMLADGTKEGAVAAINGAMGLQDDAEELDETAFADAHSLGPQRLANVLCWVYGQDPRVFGYLVEEGHLPEDRAEGCPDEFGRLSASWDRLLSPYLKPDEPSS